MIDKKQFFQNNGFLILPGAIDQTQADSIRAELETPNTLVDHVGALKRHIVIASAENKSDPKFRFKDLYINSHAARAVVFANSILDVLWSLTDEPVLAFQNIGFIRGSGLRIHRDSNYVAMQEVDAPFYACWIALEDVQEGAGELVYYPGSHLLPAYKFAENSKLWVVLRDGIYANEACHAWLEKQMAESGITPQKFLARKGDCIIWHSDLVHAGTPVLHTNQTRYSLITHFCNTSSHPRYQMNSKKHGIVKVTDRCFLSSAHYELGEIQNITELGNAIVKPKISSLTDS